MVIQTSFLEEQVKSVTKANQIPRTTEQTLRLPEAMANGILTDRLFANDLTEAEKTLSADREIARAFINDAINLELAPDRVYASAGVSGKAISQARELIRRYYYSGKNDPRGIAKPDSNPGSVAGTYENLYNKVLKTLAISNPIHYQRQMEEIPDRVLPCRYAGFRQASKKLGVRLYPLEADSAAKARLLSEYFPKFVTKKDPEDPRKWVQDLSKYSPADLGSLYLSMTRSADSYAKKSRAKIKQ